MANELKERWETEDGKERLQRIVEAIQKGQEDWPDILNDFPEIKDVKNNRDLRCADLSGINLKKAKLSNANLADADFFKSYLEKAELNNSNLSGVNFCNANLQKANLSKTFLDNAGFVCADIRGTKFNHSGLGGGFLGFGHGNIRAHVDFSNVKYNRRTSFLGTDIGINNWAGNPLLKRHIEDQQWLYAWRNKNRFNKYFLCPIWLISCDCGRSFLLWACWSLVLAIAFGFIFANCADKFNLTAYDGKTLADAHWFMPFYYSIVAFTTLGFGDVVPHANNGIMQFCVTLEVILGYIMLGGLISILANKLARRA